MSLEMIILTPVLLLLLFAAIQIALNSHARNIALAAAQDAARADGAYQSAPGAGQAAAAALLAQTGDGLGNPAVAISYTGTEVHAIVTGRAISIVPFLSWTVRQSASSPIEQVTR
ncbi:TadE/TadG family type IV pilus assembly protein [Actinoplanes sp. CA-054009]